jgi:uncharacterized membrane protein YozB (DUF420 family)
MIDAVLWMAVGALAVGVLLVVYAIWAGLIDDEDKHRRDAKHRRHHRWQG